MGFSLVILLAGLQGLPQDVLEAARVDGANAWQLTLRVITPLMRPILALTALLSIIGGLKVFDLVFIMTRGGPTYSTEVLATMLYREAFELNHMGVASAIGVILVAVVLSIARVQTLRAARVAGGRGGVSTVVAAPVAAPALAGRAARCAPGDGVVWAVLLAALAVSLAPGLYMVSLSLMDNPQLFAGRLVPMPPHPENYPARVGGEQHRAALLEQHLHLDRVDGRDGRHLGARRLRSGADPLRRRAASSTASCWSA